MINLSCITFTKKMIPTVMVERMQCIANTGRMGSHIMCTELMFDFIFPDYLSYENSTLKPMRKQEFDSPSLPRTMSDAALVRKKTKHITIAREDVESHRFCINGHFYNYEVWTWCYLQSKMTGPNAALVWAGVNIRC